MIRGMSEVNDHQGGCGNLGVTNRDVSAYHCPMTNPPDTKSPSAILAELRALLAAISREAARHQIEDVVDLAGRADKLAAELERQGKP